MKMSNPKDSLKPTQMQQKDVQKLQKEPKTEEQIEKYKLEQSNKGVCYISRIPPYMKPNYIRKLLQQYGVERIFLLKESEWLHKNRSKQGGNKRICFEEGWVQFSDKRMAKLAALTLNGQKMVQKKHHFYSEDLWNLKYLPKFKWHHLTQRLAHEERLKKQKLKMQLNQQKKIEEFYSENIHKSKKIQKIIQKKQKKGKIDQPKKQRTFQQKPLIEEEKDQ